MRETGPRQKENTEDLRQNYERASDKFYHPDMFYSPREDVRKILEDIEKGTRIKRVMRGARVGGLAAVPVAALGGVAGLAAVAVGTDIETHNPLFNANAGGAFEEIVSPDSGMQRFKAAQLVRAPFNLAQLNQAELKKIEAQITAAGFKLPEGEVDVETVRQNALAYYLEVNKWTPIPKSFAEKLGFGVERRIDVGGGKIAKISMGGSASPENQNSARDLDKVTPANLRLAEGRAAVGKEALKQLFPGVQIESVKARVATLNDAQIGELKRLSSEAGLSLDTVIKNYNTNAGPVPPKLKPYMDQYFGNTRGIEVEYEVSVPRGDKNTIWQANWKQGSLIAGGIGGGIAASLLMYLLLSDARTRRKIRKNESKIEPPTDGSVPYVGTASDYAPRTRTYGHARQGGPEPSQSEIKEAETLQKQIRALKQKTWRFAGDVITVHAKGEPIKLTVRDAIQLARDAMEVHLQHGEY